MRTINKKVLPVVRVLLAKCNENEFYHVQTGLNELTIRRLMPRCNDAFDIYSVSDNQLICFEMAVSKLNSDIVIPYKFYHEVDETYYTLCYPNSDGEVSYPTAFHEQSQFVLCTSVETFFQYQNLHHKIL
jgi:hypothetical protein